MRPALHFAEKCFLCLPHRPNRNCDVSLIIKLKNVFWSSKEPSHLIGPLKYPQHMFWLRNKKQFSITHSNQEDGYELHYQMHLNGIGSHLCTKIVFLGTLFL